VTRRLLFLICAALAVASCKRAPENKDAVRQAVIDHLSKNAALEINQLDVDVTDVQFKGNEATTQVSIKPKTAPDQGMTMSYVLDRKGDQWHVRPRSATGHGAMGGGAMGGGAMGGGEMGAAPADGGQNPSGQMPPGHPPTNTPQGGDLPPGHPPVNQAPKK
jgi:hypothetical protein